MRQFLRYCRRNLFFAHLTGRPERRNCWPAWTEPFDATRTRDAAGSNRLSLVLGEMARFLAITAAVYLLVVFVIGIL